MKSKNKQTTTNTYGWQTPPQTQAGQAYSSAINSSFDTEDPNIGYSFGAQRQRLKDSFASPFGNDVSPEVQRASLYAGEQELDQAQSVASRADLMNRKQAKLGHLGANAGMNAPVLTQTGGMTQGYQTQPIGPALIGAAGQAAGGFLS